MNQSDIILTITGSDGTGGSGIQADIRTIAALGGHAVSVITSITMQNSLGIQQFFDIPAPTIKAQLEAIIDDMAPQIVKIGMLRNAETVVMLAEMLRHYRPSHVIYDPVVRSVNGDMLMSQEVVLAVNEHLLPLCTYIIEHHSDAVHGQANLFASALCVYLSHGDSIDDASRKAKDYAEHHPTTAIQHGRSAELYRMFTENVERFYRNYNDVAFYATQLNVSSRYLAQVTRRMAARTPKQIIEQRLMNEIEKEITSTTKPLKEIAARYGFSSQAHLSRFFNNLRGMSPSEYRRQSTKH